MNWQKTQSYLSCFCIAVKTGIDVPSQETKGMAVTEHMHIYLRVYE